MVAAAVGELRGGDVEDALPRPVGNEVADARQVLVGVAETHAAADAALEVAGAAAEEEGDHALILVPDVDRAVEFGNRRGHREPAEEVVPEGAQGGECCVGAFRRAVLRQHFPRRPPIQMPGHLKFRLRRILHIPQYEDQLLACPGLQRKVETVRSHRAPPVRHGIARRAGKYLLRRIKTVVHADERLPVGIEPVVRTVHAVESVMVAPLPILRLVIEHIRLHLHFAGRQVALEILHVGGRIPETPLHETVQLERLAHTARVGQAHPVDLAACAGRHEEQHLCTEAVLLARQARVAHAMPALIRVQRRLARLPAGIPHRIAVLDIEVASARIHRHTVVAVAENAPELGVAAEAVAAGGVGDQREEVVRAHVVDPRPGRIWPGDHIFARGIVEVSELFHLRKGYQYL